MLMNAMITCKIDGLKLAMTYCDDTPIIGETL